MNSFEIYENGYKNGVSFAYIPDLEKEDLQLWGIGYKDGKTGAHKAPEKVERVARMLYEEYAARYEAQGMLTQAERCITKALESHWGEECVLYAKEAERWYI